LIGVIKIGISFFLLRLSRVFKQVLSLVFSRWRCLGNQIVKQKPGGGGGGPGLLLLLFALFVIAPESAAQLSY
jgi:hypothetical protein